MGLAFSGGTATRCLPEPEVETGEGDGEAIGVGADVCAAAVTDSNASTLNRIGYFAAIKASRRQIRFQLRLAGFGAASDARL